MQSWQRGRTGLSTSGGGNAGDHDWDDHRLNLKCLINLQAGLQRVEDLRHSSWE